MKIYNVGPDELADYEIKEMEPENFEFVVYWYESGSYDGSGEAVGLCKDDNMLYVKDLGHCSCYGPMEGGIGSGTKMTVAEFMSQKDSIHDLDPRKEIKDRVGELIPGYAPVFTEKFNLLEFL